MFFMRKTTALPSAAEALPGRATPMPVSEKHFVSGARLEYFDQERNERSRPPCCAHAKPRCSAGRNFCRSPARPAWRLRRWRRLPSR